MAPGVPTHSMGNQMEQQTSMVGATIAMTIIGSKCPVSPHFRSPQVAFS
jgi:hypothetical protein